MSLVSIQHLGLEDCLGEALLCMHSVCAAVFNSHRRATVYTAMASPKRSMTQLWPFLRFRFDPATSVAAAKVNRKTIYVSGFDDDFSARL